MVRKEGSEGEQEAKKAYRAARKDSDGALEVAINDKVSSALVDKVNLWPSTSSFYLMPFNNCKIKKKSDYLLIISWMPGLYS